MGMEVGKWVRNVAKATHAILGGARRQKGGRAVREGVGEVGPEARSSKTRGRKRPNTSLKDFTAGERGGCGEEKESFVRGSRHGQGRHSVRREWTGRGQEEVL